MKPIYLDYAAATYIDPAVLRKITPYLKRNFGNPSSLHLPGRNAKMAIENSRTIIAGILGVESQEIIFTGSGTESDNLAIFGIARAHKNKGNHVIISKIEHKAVLEAAKKLRKEGFEITYLNVDSEGMVKLPEIKKALRKNTILVSIMYANNEIGTIQPISEISKIIRDFRKNNLFPVFHTDACQAAGALDLNIGKLGVDLMTLNSSKIYGPKGAGCLYVSKNINLESLIVGGGQERNIRAGTENTALIVGFSEALKLAEKLRKKESLRLKKLRNYFIKKFLKTIPDSRLNGHKEKRLPNNINISINEAEGESLMLMLDKNKIFASTGSACTSDSLEVSHVLLATGLSPELSHCSLRFTLGRKTAKSDIDCVLKILPEIVYKLRKISSFK
ncbi:MAG: cysteine desulfurase family protein [Patescibacteria group bacterium]|nr:cysteine desulfurase family protein [Patescibacteria group bacterium]